MLISLVKIKIEGTQIIKYVNNYIYEKYLCDCIVLRPFKRNERAVKCYEKCGFEIVDVRFVNSGHFDSNYDALDARAKEILVITRKIK